MSNEDMTNQRDWSWLTLRANMQIWVQVPHATVFKAHGHQAKN